MPENEVPAGQSQDIKQGGLSEIQHPNIGINPDQSGISTSPIQQLKQPEGGAGADIQGNSDVDRGGSTVPDDRSDGRLSEQVSDIDKARAMAEAGNSKNMEAAYLRRAASIKDSDLPLDKQDEQLAKLKDDYKHNAQEHLVREYSPKYLEEFAEEPAAEAERLEFWAGEIHEHQDIAGELTPQDCVNIENWIEENATRPIQIDRQIVELKVRDEEGKLPLREVIQRFHDIFGSSGKSDVQRRFNELTSNNATTVGEIKGFLYEELNKKADGWRKGLDISRNRLAVVQGK